MSRPVPQSISEEDLRVAAMLWAIGMDTFSIGRSLGVPQHLVHSCIEPIKREARLVKARAS